MPVIPWKYIKEHIFPLPSNNPNELGEKLTYCGLETKIIDYKGNIYFEFVTLPNRPDLLSWRGISYEIGVLLDCKVKSLNFPFIAENKDKLIDVEITTSNCLDFNLGLIKEVKVEESPIWLKEWLEVNNIRSINNIVDFGNLVMLESGQPLHIFDYDKLSKDKKIIVRQAQEGENITTIQGRSLILNSQDIVISSGEKLIDLAGIVGGKDTIITLQTKSILIECASFDAETIKKTTNHLNIKTDASHYFCRGTNLILSPKQALQTFISLVNEDCKKVLETESIFAYHNSKKKDLQKISISREFIEKKTGQKFAENAIESIWKRLNFSCQKEGDFYHITVPSYRIDITNAEDLLEELLRIYDYNKLDSSLPNNTKTCFFNSKNIERKRKTCSYLTNCGWQEIITYSLVSKVMAKEFNAQNSFHQLLMPKNESHKYYRQTLIPSHLNTISYNLSHSNKNLFFFEISTIYNANQREELLTLSGKGKLFDQSIHHNLIQNVDFYWIKGTLENIFHFWQLDAKISFSPSTLNYLYPPQSAEIFLEKEKIGFFGLIIPQITKNYQINQPVFIAQVSLTKVFNYLGNFPQKILYKPISNFPISEKDLSFTFPENTNHNLVMQAIKNVGSENLQEINMFDVYQNTEMAKEGQKSVSYHLVFQSSKKTLENKEIEKIIKNIIEKIESSFDAKLRA